MTSKVGPRLWQQFMDFEQTFEAAAMAEQKGVTGGK
jgi:hypothetical protein